MQNFTISFFVRTREKRILEFDFLYLLEMFKKVEFTFAIYFLTSSVNREIAIQ